ncbi:helix-turn-helix transcriptional regulator [Shewanella sp. 202IG2-18]|uniref:helix-turn-helix transcriptional regulator n=1 Tax=Parashewanella hymeniacidonis TaxID=2807618 RepID=UPI00196027DC|nr:helix-turn-helix transcriptional regulator [Parashewanella hymeniacidonis]MBM7070753.1 helix-turn-helix transcriptional regulator [Parashewanella hymeniacidonis]
METTLGERLERALIEVQMTQSQLAQKAGVTQQAISYIIKHKVDETKMAPKLAEALGVNPSWLILGIGRLYKDFGTELPIISSFVLLQKFLRDGVTPPGTPTVLTEADLSPSAFAYQTELHKVALCDLSDDFNATEFLHVQGAQLEVVTEPMTNAYPIYEWRVRSVEF